MAAAWTIVHGKQTFIPSKASIKDYTLITEERFCPVPYLNISTYRDIGRNILERYEMIECNNSKSGIKLIVLLSLPYL